jgi:hypothetical protein
VNPVESQTSSTALVNAGAQLAPLLVPMLKFGSTPANKRGMLERIE